MNTQPVHEPLENKHEQNVSPKVLQNKLYIVVGVTTIFFILGLFYIFFYKSPSGITSLNSKYSHSGTFGSKTDSMFGSDSKSWNAPNGNEVLYAENLPSCQGTELFNSPPAVDGTYNNISPLGHTSSYNGNTGHVFPVDHMSFDLKHLTPGDRMTSSLPAILLAPGDIEIYKVSHTTYEKDGKVTGNDYAIFYAPCREVTGYFGHVTSISSKIQMAVDQTDKKNCQTPFTTGGGGSLTFKQCNYSLLLNLKNGEQIGTAGGPDVMTKAFDYGVYDQRIQPLPFINPKYWTPMNLHAVCGLYYYPNGPVKNSLLRKIDNTKKDPKGFPDCGTNMWDKKDTIQGNWVLPNTPTGYRVPDPEGLAVVHLYNDPNQGLIDWGGTIAPADRIQFPFTSSGLINREPGDIKADGQVYCFQDLSFGSANARSIKLQLVDSNTLKAEYHNGVCPSSPALSHPTTYVR